MTYTIQDIISFIINIYFPSIPIYNVVRFVLWHIFIAIATLIFVFGNEKKWLFRILVPSGIIFLALSIAAQNYPIENIVANYKSPQSALNYVMEGKISTSVNGKDSTLVVHSYHDVDSHDLLWYHYKIFPRAEKGWKIVKPNATYDELWRYADPYDLSPRHKSSVWIIRNLDKHGYYVIVNYYSSYHPSIDQGAVKDNLNSEFTYFVEPDGLNVGDAWWITYVESLDQDYEIYIEEKAFGIRSKFFDEGGELLSFDDPLNL
jgi:hypothetical protein